MKVAVFSTKSYDREFLDAANQAHKMELDYYEPNLKMETAKLAHGYEAVCIFVNDHANKAILEDLYKNGTRLIALRCSGFNNVDVKAAEELGIKILRVPAYSPQGVAEHAIALMLALNRKIHRAHNRVRENNFSIEGLLGFEMAGLYAGIVGTGAIGQIVAHILKGFGMNILAYDTYPNQACIQEGVEYVELNELLKRSDVVSLHLPLMRETYHLINKESIAIMKKGVMLINTSRGGLIDTAAVIQGLKTGGIGYLGLDVYEEEGDLFFEDLSSDVMKDDIFARLTTFPNVVITAHQAFFTEKALTVIAETTLKNILAFKQNKIEEKNLVTLKNTRL